MNTVKVAIATVDKKGLRDQVSAAFARTPTFTLVEIRDNKVKNVKTIVNPAASKSHGRGPLAVQTLSRNVSTVVASEFGPSVSAMLDAHRIHKLMVKPKTPVIDVIKELRFAFSQF
jgi:predicted Fe-Mo cluster-binding NifX family protein